MDPTSPNLDELHDEHQQLVDSLREQIRQHERQNLQFSQYVDQQNLERLHREQQHQQGELRRPAISRPPISDVLVQLPGGFLAMGLTAPLQNQQSHVQSPSPPHVGPRPNRPRPPRDS